MSNESASKWKTHIFNVYNMKTASLSVVQQVVDHIKKWTLLGYLGKKVSATVWRKKGDHVRKRVYGVE